MTVTKTVPKVSWQRCWQKDICLSVLSRTWDDVKLESPWRIEPQTIEFCSPMLHHWATETLQWADSPLSLYVTQVIHTLKRPFPGQVNPPLLLPDSPAHSLIHGLVSPPHFLTASEHFEDTKTQMLEYRLALQQTDLCFLCKGNATWKAMFVPAPCLTCLHAVFTKNEVKGGEW